MATREKTIVFASSSDTTVLTDNTFFYKFIDIYIPETVIAFTSVYAEVSFQDVVTATGSSIAQFECRCQLANAATSQTYLTTNGMTNSAENIAGVIGPIDFTSHFQTNWVSEFLANPVSFATRFQQSGGTTLGMRNVSILLYITYTYDDTAATQVKTVRIPFTTLPSGTTTAAQNLGGANNLPALTGVGGLLPEANVVIQDYFFVIEANEGQGTTATDFTLTLSYASGGGSSTYTQECGLASNRWCRWVSKATIPDTGAAQSVRLLSSITNRVSGVSVVLYVTYEFTIAGTSRVLNSTLLPLEIVGAVADDNYVTRRSVFIPEANPALKQSAVALYYQANGSTTGFRASAGTQTGECNATKNISVVCGMLSSQFRIDVGEAGLTGAALTLTRGRQDLDVRVRVGSASLEATNVSGVVILNYESDLSSDGVGAHSHTLLKVAGQFQSASSDLVEFAAKTLNPVDSDYFVQAAGYMSDWSAWAGATGIGLDVEILSGEKQGDGYESVYMDGATTDTERGWFRFYASARSVFQRFPEDTDHDRLALSGSRATRMYANTNIYCGVVQVMTYHSQTWDVAGNISGNNGALATEVTLMRVEPHEPFKKQTLSAGVTSFSFTVYDPTEEFYVVAKQSDSVLGVSAIGLAA